VGVGVCVWVGVCGWVHIYIYYFGTSICSLRTEKLFNSAEAKDPPLIKIPSQYTVYSHHPLSQNLDPSNGCRVHHLFL